MSPRDPARAPLDTASAIGVDAMAGAGRVRIVTDSTADLPSALALSHGITVVPLKVTFGSDTFDDGVLSQREFFDRMNAAPKLPTTSQPAAGSFVEAYRIALEHAVAVVSIHISSALSGTVESARQAAAQFGDRVRVVDSRNLSWGLGFQVLEAAKAAASGAHVEAVVRAVERARDRSNLIIVLDSLENLAKGGRIGKVTALLGGLLDLKVLFTVSEGAFHPVARMRGTKAATKRMLAWVEERLREYPKASFCVLQAMAGHTAEQVREAIQERFDPSSPIPIVETGAVIAAHTGSGWAVAFLAEDA
jgi:DegV family protein with EDD domain